jgi:hypothetical protein
MIAALIPSGDADLVAIRASKTSWVEVLQGKPHVFHFNANAPLKDRNGIVKMDP